MYLEWWWWWSASNPYSIRRENDTHENGAKVSHKLQLLTKEEEINNTRPPNRYYGGDKRQRWLMKMVYLLTKWVLLGTLDTNLSGRSTRKERKIVRSKGKEDSAVIVTNLSNELRNHFRKIAKVCLHSSFRVLKTWWGDDRWYVPGDDDDEVHDVPSIA